MIATMSSRYASLLFNNDKNNVVMALLRMQGEREAKEVSMFRRSLKRWRE